MHKLQDRVKQAHTWERSQDLGSLLSSLQSKKWILSPGWTEQQFVQIAKQLGANDIESQQFTDAPQAKLHADGIYNSWTPNPQVVAIHVHTQECAGGNTELCYGSELLESIHTLKLREQQQVLYTNSSGNIGIGLKERSIACWHETIQEYAQNKGFWLSTQQGDVLFIDNHAMVHGRQAYVGFRKIIRATIDTVTGYDAGIKVN